MLDTGGPFWNPRYWRQEFVRQLKVLRGKPHRISLGLAIGVFVAATPTIPFHTVLAVGLAVLLRGSKLAAALGVWVSNPLTIPFLYYGSYRLGLLALGLPAMKPPEHHSILSIMKLGTEVAGAMLLGGIILGIIPAVAVYVIALRVTSSARFRGKRA